MLRLLTDGNISPVVAEQVVRHEPTCPIASLHVWKGGRLLDEADELILAEAHLQGLTLVTRDITTIPTIVRTWHLTGHSHSGVIYADDRTIPEGNVGALVRAIIRFWRAERDRDWENSSAYVPR